MLMIQQLFIRQRACIQIEHCELTKNAYFHGSLLFIDCVIQHHVLSFFISPSIDSRTRYRCPPIEHVDAVIIEINQSFNFLRIECQSKCISLRIPLIYRRVHRSRYQFPSCHPQFFLFPRTQFVHLQVYTLIMGKVLCEEN